jgi:DNA repair protein RecN (Recombination protein N)
MLVELQVKNLALIAQANIEFGQGLTVLTGETGAGKTALLSALKLLIGERSTASLVRDGQPEASVQALFSKTEMASTTEDHVVVRRVSADGRSRCYLDDTMVTVKTLAETIGPEVDLYGQHEHQSLLKPDQQLAALDLFAGDVVVSALSHYQQEWQSYRDAAKQLAELEDSVNSSSVAKEQAAFVLREIAKVAPLPDEYQQLREQLPILQNGEELSRVTNNAVDLLRGDGQTLDKLALLVSELDALRNIDPELDKLTAQANELLIAADDLALELRQYRDAIEFDTDALDLTLERLGQLEGLCKRFGPTIADVFEAQKNAELLVGDSTSFDQRLADARANLQQHALKRQQAAQELSDLRDQAAQQFTKHLELSVGDLAMSGAGFEFAITKNPEQNWTLNGPNSYELLYRPDLNSKPRPLARIASGGELSRVMLALKTMLHANEQPMTLVFDEIDAGIGGATATAVAERIRQLANTHQVIVVTHLAQIASKADAHFVVKKESSLLGSSTAINQVSGESRVQELARMLSGDTNKTALEHARELLGA